MPAKKFALTLRALIGFGLGSLAAALYQAWALTFAGPETFILSIFFIFVLLGAGAFAGAVTAGASLPALRAAVAFGVAFIIAWFGEWMMLMGSQGPGPGHLQAIVESAFCYGIAGLVAALILSPRYTHLGLAAFALGAVLAALLRRPMASLAGASFLRRLCKDCPQVLSLTAGGILFGLLLDLKSARYQDTRYTTPFGSES